MTDLWYHGTTVESINEIINTGKFKVSKDKPEHAFDVSLPDRVYLSRNLEGAIQHGSQHVEIDENFGVLEIEVKDESLLLPDELGIGYLITLGYYDIRAEEIAGSLDEILDYNYPALPDDDQQYIFGLIWKRLSGGIKDTISKMSQEDLLDQEKAVHVGVRIIQYLSAEDPDFMEELIGSSHNLTSPPDNLIITGAWEGRVRDFQRELMELGEEIDPWKLNPGMRLRSDRFPLSTHGIGRGWHGQSYRHALASRGVRTR